MATTALPTRPRRTPGVARTALTMLTLLVAGLLLGGTAAPASAEDGFRYWNYSHLEGDTFAFAQTGPADFTPKDGGVEGWRFGTSTVSQGLEPRANLDEVGFDAVCGDTDAAEGEKRVAVLIDYGTDAEAASGAEIPQPVAECAVVPGDANGQQTLESVAQVRADGAMICAIDGYPAKGCGEPVSDATVSADQQPVEFTLTGAAADDGGGNSGAVAAIVAALIAILGGTAFAVNRRRQSD